MLCLLTDTHEILSVFAGSALWLDCSVLARPVQSLLQVTWYRRGELLYYQYFTNGQIIGYPPNSTAAFMFAARVTSHSVGQINVWPVAPDEGGVYQCDVLMADDSSPGIHSTLSKTFTVYVSEFYSNILQWKLLLVYVRYVGPVILLRISFFIQLIQKKIKQWTISQLSTIARRFQRLYLRFLGRPIQWD